jgi:hypothetical protein
MTEELMPFDGKDSTGFGSGLRGARLFAVVLLGLFGGARPLAAQFDSGIIDFTYGSYGPGPAVIGSAGDLWNTAAWGTSTGPLTLYKTDGTQSSAVWALVSGGGQWGPLGGIYGKLFEANTSLYSASITGLTPNEEYYVYVYSAIWDQEISVNGVYFSSAGTHNLPINSLTVGSQYDVHEVTADSVGTLQFAPVWPLPPYAPDITSWQLTPVTPVPEPSPVFLVGLPLAIFGARQFVRALKRRA